jgi:putative transcriptional regulator
MENSLKLRRAANGWSQAQLADIVGVSRQTVNALEKGRYDPSLPLAFKLARAFSTTIEDLFTPSDDELALTADPSTAVAGKADR